MSNNITNERTPLELLEIALKKGEMVKYLLGEEIYYFPNKWIEVPTDLSIIFLRGFNLYVERGENLDFFYSSINEVLIKLLESATGCWWCISLLHTYYFAFIDNALFFKLDIQNLIPQINLSLCKHKNELYGNKEWVGVRFEKGLWDDLLNKVPKLNEKLKIENVTIFLPS